MSIYTKRSGFRRVTQDIVDLFELQMQLLSVDSQEASRKSMRAVALGAGGLTLAGSALTGLIIGCGFLLHELAGWTVGVSLLTVAAAFVVIGLNLLLMAKKAVDAAAAAMSETKSEFTENLKWLKAVIISPETSPRNQIRAESFPPSTAVSGDERDQSSSRRESVSSRQAAQDREYARSRESDFNGR